MDTGVSEQALSLALRGSGDGFFCFCSELNLQGLHLVYSCLVDDLVFMKQSVWAPVCVPICRW
jgi:hypothetical protein